MISRDPFTVRRACEDTAVFEAMLHDPSKIDIVAAASDYAASHTIPYDAVELTRELEIAARKFCWSQRGVGVYCGQSPEERSIWQNSIAQMHKQELDGEFLVGSVEDLFGVNTLMPTCRDEAIEAFERAGAAVRSTSGDLSAAVSSMVTQTTIDPNENITLVLHAPEIPNLMQPVFDFYNAVNIGNKSAKELYDQGSRKIYEHFGGAVVGRDTPEGRRATTRIQHLQRRIDRLITEYTKQYPAEQVVGELRKLGQTVSPILAQALEFHYHHRLVEFIDAGSAYRGLPEGVRIALITDDTMYRILLARGYRSAYSTVSADSEAGLGVYPTIPYTTQSSNQYRADILNAGLARGWDENPLYELQFAALLYADSELDELDIEN